MKRSSFIVTATLLFGLMSGFAIAQSATININNADSATLATLSGIGQNKADEIIKYREANGPFANAQDLARVKGIGAKTVEKNADRLTVRSIGNDSDTKAP